jgi:hypothetical protein
MDVRDFNQLVMNTGVSTDDMRKLLPEVTTCGNTAALKIGPCE